jgi:outer membrane protein OmpA-like peptidoglycan-associated protein
MKKLKLTESELIRLVQKLVSEQPTPANLRQQQSTTQNTNIQRAAQGVPAPGTFAPKPPLNTGSYTPMRSKEAMRSDIDAFNELHGRQPSTIQTLQAGQTLTLGQNLFETGIDSINKNSKEFKDAVTALTNLPPKTTVKVTGGASAVGSSRGYDNKALSMRRANNMIRALRENPKLNHIILVPDGIVGKNTEKNSPGARAEQFVKLTRERTITTTKTTSAIDNTQNVTRYPGFTLPSTKPNPNQGTLRGIEGINRYGLNENKIKEIVRQNILELFDSQEFSGRYGLSRGTPLTFGEKLKRAMEKCIGQIGSESSLPDGTPLSDSPFCRKLRDIKRDIELGAMFIDENKIKKIAITESQLKTLLKKRTKHLKNRLIKEEMDMSQYDEDFLTPRAYMTPENMDKAATELYNKLKRNKEGGEPSSDYETAMKEKLGLNEPSSEEEMNIRKHGDTELEGYDETISLDDFENMGSEIPGDSYLNEGQIKMKNVYKKYIKNPIIKGLSK